MKIINFITVGAVFFLSACSLLSPKAEYIPEDSGLKPASVGVPYFAKINILGGRVISAGYLQEAGYMPGTVIPADAGISLRNCLSSDSTSGTSLLTKKPFYDTNCVEIYGMPNKAVNITIRISGGMYGSMIAPASEFSKDYTIVVGEP